MTLAGAETHFEPAANPLTQSGDVSVGFGDNHHIDAFGRLKISDPKNVWDSQFQYDLLPTFYDTTTATNGTVTHDANKSSALCNVSTDSGSQAIIQSFQYHRYQPGKSQSVTMTFLMADATTNLDQRVGQFDDDNGFFLELTDTTVNMVRRTKTSGSVANNATAQASWNIDVMDGNGRSKVLLDLTKVQILHIDYQWLSTGRIRYGFDIDGILHYVHEELVANTLDVPSTTTANLPVRWEAVTTDTTAGARTLQAICVSVVSEGGVDEQLVTPFSIDTGLDVTGLSVGTTLIPIISIRPKATFNSITNRGVIFLTGFDAITLSEPLGLRILYNASLTNASFNSADATSITEFDIAATAVTGGQQIGTSFIPASAIGANNSPGIVEESLTSRLPLTLDAAGSNPISITLAATVLNGTASETWGSLSWREQR